MHPEMAQCVRAMEGRGYDGPRRTAEWVRTRKGGDSMKKVGAQLIAQAVAGVSPGGGEEPWDAWREFSRLQAHGGQQRIEEWGPIYCGWNLATQILAAVKGPADVKAASRAEIRSRAAFWSLGVIDGAPAKVTLKAHRDTYVYTSQIDRDAPLTVWLAGVRAVPALSNEDDVKQGWPWAGNSSRLWLSWMLDAPRPTPPDLALGRLRGSNMWDWDCVLNLALDGRPYGSQPPWDVLGITPTEAAALRSMAFENAIPVSLLAEMLGPSERYAYDGVSVVAPFSLPGRYQIYKLSGGRCLVVLLRSYNGNKTAVSAVYFDGRDVIALSPPRRAGVGAKAAIATVEPLGDGLRVICTAAEGEWTEMRLDVPGPITWSAEVYRGLQVLSGDPPPPPPPPGDVPPPPPPPPVPPPGSNPPAPVPAVRTWAGKREKPDEPKRLQDLEDHEGAQARAIGFQVAKLIKATPLPWPRPMPATMTWAHVLMELRDDDGAQARAIGEEIEELIGDVWDAA